MGRRDVSFQVEAYDDLVQVISPTMPPLEEAVGQWKPRKSREYATTR